MGCHVVLGGSDSEAVGPQRVRGCEVCRPLPADGLWSGRRRRGLWWCFLVCWFHCCSLIRCCFVVCGCECGLCAVSHGSGVGSDGGWCCRCPPDPIASMDPGWGQWRLETWASFGGGPAFLAGIELGLDLLEFVVPCVRVFVLEAGIKGGER